MALDFDWEWGVQGTYHQREMDMESMYVDAPYVQFHFTSLDVRCHKHGDNPQTHLAYILLRIIGPEDEVKALDTGTVMDLVRCRYGVGI